MTLLRKNNKTKVMKINMPYQVNVKETSPKLSSDTVVLVQPKYDGTQGIFTQYDGRPVCATRSGMVLPGAQKLAEEIPNKLGGYTLFCELEPEPWSEKGKWKLPSSLQGLGEYIPWKATAFDICTTAEFQNEDYLKTTDYKTRYAILKSLEPQLTALGVSIAPSFEMSLADAMREIEHSYQTQGDGSTRAIWRGIKCEGIVIKSGTLMYKVKPTRERDIYIQEAIESPKGQKGWVGIDTKEPHGKPVVIFGGVTPDIWQSMVGKVVEIRELAVSGAAGGGNPTFIRSREYEKEFTPER